MSSANLDLVRSIYADWECGDFSSAEWADPDIEFVIADGPAPGSWRGRSDMSRAWRDVLDTWENWQVEADEFRELDGEQVLVLNRVRARGKTSGMELEAMWGIGTGPNLFRVRSSKVTRLVIYFQSRRLLADVGLEG
jgi:hypothetical protein